MSTVNKDNANASVSLFTPISAPILRSVDPSEIAKFLKERERYELEIQSKQSEIPSLKVLPYKASIDHQLLDNLVFMGKFDELAPDTEADKLSNDNIEKFIKSIIEKEDVLYDPNVIDKALKGLRMPMYINDAEARVTQFCSEFFNRLNAVGYGKFRTENPEQTVKLMIQYVYPTQLKDEMQKCMDLNKPIRKDVKKFISRLSIEATNCQSYASIKYPKLPKPAKPEPGISPNGKDEIPLCLWKPHRDRGIRHKLSDCRDCPKDEKSRLYEELRKSKKEKNHIKRMKDEASKDASKSEADAAGILFGATFGNKINQTICADMGADVNLMDEKLFEKIISQEINVKSQKLSKPVVYEMAAEDESGVPAKIKCDKKIILDMELHIRHGTSLILRNVSWFVTSQAVSEPLLGRPVLEALGLNTSDILAAAADRYNGSLDLSHLCSANDGGRIARLYEGVYHSDRGDDEEPSNETEQWLDLGEDTHEDWEAALKIALDDASKNGISDNGRSELENLIREFKDVIRLRLNGREPAKVQPLEIHLKPNSVPVRAPQRKYSPEKREFMEKYVDNLLALGFVVPTEDPEWVSAPHIVPKKPPAMFRMAIDNRPINAATVPIFWPMPDINNELSDVKDSKCFCGIDFCSGYWQLPMAEKSQPLHAFMTSRGVVQPTRTTQGAINSAANFQQKVEPCFADLRKNFKAWIDDFILYTKDEKEMLALLRGFFKICYERNLVISLPKSKFFAKSIKWCGRIIDGDGYRYDPSNYEALKNTVQPTNAAELCQFVHAANWMGNSIPELHKQVAPLREILEKSYTAAGSRKKRSVKKIRLSDQGWSDAHTLAFEQVKKSLRNAVELSHRDPAKIICVHTDASDKFWSGIVTQCDPSELQKTKMQQKHQPLAFLGSQFSPTQERWTTYEQEAFAIYETFKRLKYMMICDQGIHIFTDHKNLLFTFHPLSVEPTIARHKMMKVARWALFMSTFNYVIEHVDGESNDFPDMLTRWMKGYRSSTSCICRVRKALPYSGIPQSPYGGEFEWPDRETILSAQLKSQIPKDCVKGDDNIFRKSGKIWIPDDANDLKLQLLSISHAGEAGHRGVESTIDCLKSEFTWNGLAEETKEFVNDCLLCVISKSGNRVPRPLSTGIHATKPGQILHFDYLYLGRSSGIEKYVLVLKDDLSSYCWLEPVDGATAENAAIILARWNRIFTAPEIWVSDQGPHFINSTMEILANDFRILHKPTVAYSPWANGTVEALMRTVLAALRTMMLELKLAPQDWKEIITAIPSIINSAGLVRLGSNEDGSLRSPLQVMTGILPNRPITRIIPANSDINSGITISEANGKKLININCLQNNLQELHKDVTIKVSNRRMKAISAHNKSTNIVEPKFEIGDFVLVRRAVDRGHKLQYKWFGPLRVEQVHSPLVYSVAKFNGTDVHRVHATRLIRYAPKLEGTNVPKEILDLADHTTAKFEAVDSFVDIAEDVDQAIMVRVCWDGLPDERDWTWHKAEHMYEDVPDMFLEYLDSIKDGPKKSIVKKLQCLLNIS